MATPKTDQRKLQKLIAIIDNPTAFPPGHTIKEAMEPYVPVASVPVNQGCSPEAAAHRKAYALVLAAAPEMAELLAEIFHFFDAMKPGPSLSQKFAKAKAKKIKELLKRAGVPWCEPEKKSSRGR